jgi:nitrous oxidase accessory protein
MNRPNGYSGIWGLQMGLLLLMTFYSFFCAAGTVKVDQNGKVKTIQEALAMSGSGDTILVYGGNYSEGTILIDKPLTLIGIDRPIIDGHDRDSDIIIIASDSVTLEGFTIQNAGTSYIKDLAGIRVRRKNNFVIRNNHLINTMFGIYLEKANDGKIVDNQVIGQAIEEVSSGNGIHAWYCKNLFISGNTIVSHRDGIYFEFVESSQLVDNISRNNLRYGLHFMFSNNDEYTNNLFEKNGAGVAVMFSKNINMYQNTFANNWGSASYGLLLKEIYDARIEENIFDGNTMGIKVDGSTRVTYHNNSFENNGWAIKFVGGSYDNKINNNNFISNSFDLVLESARNNNTINGNYWSSYTGYDLDKNGIGDIPFRPVKLFSYIVSRTPESMVLLRSLFIDIIDFSERVRPMFTPENVMDHAPLMNKVVY